MARSARDIFRSEELAKLAADISDAPARIQFQSSKLLATKAGPIIAREMRRDASGHKGNWFGIPGTEYDTPLQNHVSYEMVTRDRLEVGIEYEGAGKLAHIIVHGSVNNDPVYDFMAGPRRALPRVERAFADIAEESVLGGDE